MPRQPTLRKKTVKNSTYWFTKAGGETYFGRVDEVGTKDARKLFAEHLAKLRTDEAQGKAQEFTAGDLMDLFLAWVEQHRDKQNYATRRNYCSRFGSFL